ncbi:MAG: hypothetical protein II598_02555 [Elusimicrobia bacterium]|nr:hypothetical protein [Elusimicrobiota bacterium]
MTTKKKPRLIVEMSAEEKQMYLEKIDEIGQTISTAVRRALKQYLQINN